MACLAAAAGCIYQNVTEMDDQILACHMEVSLSISISFFLSFFAEWFHGIKGRILEICLNKITFPTVHPSSVATVLNVLLSLGHITTEQHPTLAIQAMNNVNVALENLVKVMEGKDDDTVAQFLVICGWFWKTPGTAEIAHLAKRSVGIGRLFLVLIRSAVDEAGTGLLSFSAHPPEMFSFCDYTRLHCTRPRLAPAKGGNPYREW